MAETATTIEDAERDRLWDRSLFSLYDTLYHETLVATYIRRLEFLNTTAIIFATVFGGAGMSTMLAKLTVWKTPGGELLWGGLLFLALVTEGTRRALKPEVKLRGCRDTLPKFTLLRHELEEFRSLMLHKDFDLKVTSERYETLHKQFKKLSCKCPVSFVLHVYVRRRCQAEVDRSLKDYFE